MKWQTAAAILVSILIGVGTITYTDLFGVLFQLSGISYTHSGDISCETTCESYINITTTYWRICFAGYEDTKYENKTLFKKRSRSRTLHVNLDNIENVISTNPKVEVDWLVPARGRGNWREIKDGDCWERPSTREINKIKLVGHKEASQTVKWNFNVGEYVEIDPKWIGEPTNETPINETPEYNESHQYEYEPESKTWIIVPKPEFRGGGGEIPPNTIRIDSFQKEVRTEKYTHSTYESCFNGKCSLVLYSGTRFADSSGTKIEEAKSLKTCEFCDNIKLDIQEDKKYSIKVIDYNYTSITLDVKADTLELNKDIPLKVYNRYNESDVKFETTAKLTSVSDKKNYVIPFGFDKEIKWGENSIKLRVNLTRTNSADIIDDYTTGCSGTGFSTVTADLSDISVGFANFQSGYETRTYMEFDTSSIPDTATVNDATLWAYLSLEIWEGTENENASVFTCNYGTAENSDFENTVLEHNHGILFTDDSVSGQYHSIELNVSGDNISKTGVSQFCIYPDGNCRDESDIWQIETTTVSVIPYLNITYFYQYRTNIGIFNQTHYNTSIEGVQLNLSESLITGTYIGTVINISDFTVAVSNISWDSSEPVGTNISVSVRANTINISLFGVGDGLYFMDGALGEYPTSGSGTDVVKNYAGTLRELEHYAALSGVGDWITEFTENGQEATIDATSDGGCSEVGLNDANSDIYCNTNCTYLMRVLLPNLPSGGGTTYSQWGQDTATGQIEFQQTGGDYALYIVPTDDFAGRVTLDSNVPIVLNQFMWVGFRVENMTGGGNNVSFWIDGVMVASVNKIITRVGDMWVGGAELCRDQMANNTVQIAMIFNKSISDAQITDFMTSNWTEFTEKNSINPNVFSGDTVNGTHVQAKFYEESNSTIQTPSLYSYDIGIRNLTVAAPPVGDTCDCSSIQAGTTIDCSENCDIEACDAEGQDILFFGTGTITISGDITNHGTVDMYGTDSNNKCFVKCLGGCFQTT